jgi:sulfur carrier protein
MTTDTPPAAEVRVNGEAHVFVPGMSLARLLVRLGVAPDSVATAVNGEFVARALRGRRLLQPGDDITLFQPIVGG